MLEASNRFLRPQDPSTLDIMKILASNYKEQRRIFEAEELELLILKKTENSYGPTNLETLKALESLALSYQHKQSWEEARMLYLEVIETREALFGREDTQTIASTMRLASVYSDEMRWKEAGELLTCIMRITAESPRAHYPILLVLAGLANVQRHLGRWKESENLDLQVKKLFKSSPNPSMIISASQLMDEYESQGRINEAVEIGILLIDLMEHKLWVQGFFKPTITSRVASSLASLGFEKDATSLRIQVMESTKEKYEIENTMTWESMISVILAYRRQGRWLEAEELCVQVLEISENIFGTHHPNTLRSMISMVPQYWHRHQWNLAEESSLRLVEESEDMLGTKHPLTLDLRH